MAFRGQREALPVNTGNVGLGKRILGNPHFWLAIITFIICVLLQYPQQLLASDAPSLFSPLGLTRHAVERILFLFPVIYSCYIFGTIAGLTSLFAAAIVMLPRVFLFSPYFADSMAETAGILVIGGLIILIFDRYKKEREREQQTLAKLQVADRQLQSVFQITRHSEERLWALNQVGAVLSQSLELNEILKAATEDIKQVMGLDAVLIFLLNEDKKDFSLATHLGVSEDYVVTVKSPAFIDSPADRFVEIGKTKIVEDTFKETGPVREAEQWEGIRAEVIVPLKTKGTVAGALVGAMREPRHFLDDEVELLSTFGNQIGMAIENARSYQRECAAAELALASERRYRELFERAHDAIWVHDLEGNIIAANRAAEDLTGYSWKDAEVHRMNVHSFLTQESLALAGKIRAKIFSGEKVAQPYEQRIIRKDGTEAIVKLTTSLVTDNGRPVGFQNIARDVTREKEMQDQLSKAYNELSESHRELKESQEQLIQVEKLTSLGQLAASIAHEVNNPLSGVLVYNQLLAKKIKSDTMEKDQALGYLSKMEAELIRSTKLIRNLLDFARQSPPAFRQVDLNEIIQRAFDLTAHSAQLQHVHVTRELDPALPGVMADSDQLQQVCTNLILNSIQAMPGGGNLSVRTSVCDGQVKLDVQDTGVGISKENLSKLYTPFFTTKREVKGVGLGLAVSYGIIQRHHGRIEVQSKEGVGTTFTVYLPLSAENPEEHH